MESRRHGDFMGPVKWLVFLDPGVTFDESSWGGEMHMKIREM